jgi:hypothetical protein
MPRAAKSSHSLELGEQERLTAQTLACRWCVWACRIEKARTAVEEFSLEGHPGQCVLHSEENSAHANNTPTHLRCETRQLGRPQTAALFLESLPCRKAIWPPTSLYDSERGTSEPWSPSWRVSSFPRGSWRFQGYSWHSKIGVWACRIMSAVGGKADLKPAYQCFLPGPGLVDVE